MLDDLYTTIESKNTDYGDSFAKLYRKFGLQYPLIRQLEKTDRLDNLIMGQGEAKVTDESVEDTIRDIAGYAVLTLVTMQKEKKDNIPDKVPFNHRYVMAEPVAEPITEHRENKYKKWLDEQ